MVELSAEDKELINNANRMMGEQQITQESDLKGVMKELNSDEIEKHTGFASIDTRARLHPFEIVSMTVHDTIISLNCLPKICLNTTRCKKRLSVSINGKGREEMVKIVQGERENDAKKSGGMLSKLFKPADG